MKICIQSIFKWLLVLAIFIFASAILTAPRREGMDNESTSDIMLTKPNSDDTKKELMEKFKYFKMLPEDNQWSQETIDAFKIKYKEVMPNSAIDDAVLKDFQKFGSEEEAKIFIETGRWPVNEYTISNIKKVVGETMKDKSEEEQQKASDDLFKSPINNLPNSNLLFNWNIAPLVNGQNAGNPEDLKGQPKFLVNAVQTKLKLGDKSFQCGIGNKPYIATDGKSAPEEITDYKEIEKIPGFKFLQSPCNPCSNRCPYSYEDVTLPAYAVYWGISSKTGKAGASEVGAPNMEEGKLKTCLIKANKKIIDMGGEPEACN